ncbi:MAG: hypothetical protein HQK54_02000 [Oligoflexales bacterium]|nr:hypothetical protein [Oligoflexales bacterium]
MFAPPFYLFLAGTVFYSLLISYVGDGFIGQRLYKTMPWTILMLILVSSLLFVKKSDFDKKIALPLSLLIIIGLMLTASYPFGIGNITLVTLPCAFLVLCAMFVGRIWPLKSNILWPVTVGATFLTGICSRIMVLKKYPFAAQSDMLLLIRKALSEFVKGNSPYIYHIMDQTPNYSYKLPLTYLPLKWLLYLPVHIVSADLRLLNIAIEALCFIITVHFITSRVKNMEDRLAMFVLVAAYYLNSYFILRIDTEISVFNLFILLFTFSFFMSERLFVDAVLGLALAANQLALLFLPFIFLYRWKNQSIRRAFAGITISGLAFSVFIVPFLFFSLDGFLYGIIGHWKNVEIFKYQWAYQNINNLNMSMLFYKFDLQAYLKILQLVIFFSIFVLYCQTRSYKSKWRTMVFSMVGLYWFLSFNVVVWTYLYQPLFLGFVLLFILQYGNIEMSDSRAPFRMSLCSAIALAGIFLYFHMYNFSNPYAHIPERNYDEAFFMLRHGHLVRTDFSVEPLDQSCSPGKKISIDVLITNDSKYRINSDSKPPVFLAYQFWDSKKEVLLVDGQRIRIDLQPNSRDMRIHVENIVCPDEKKTVWLRLQLVQESVGWQRDCYPPSKFVEMEMIQETL